MGMFEPVSVAADRVMAALVAGLELEFKRGAGRALAARFVAAEESDFTWEARLEERWLGSYQSLEQDGPELDRIGIIGRLEGYWFVAVSIVDGEGQAQGMIGRRSFSRARLARQAFANLH